MKKISVILVLLFCKLFLSFAEEINRINEVNDAENLREWLVLQEDFANLQKNHLSEKVVLEAEIRALEIANAHLEMQANLLERTIEKQKTENQKKIESMADENNKFWQRYQQTCNDYYKKFSVFFENSPVINWSCFAENYEKAALEKKYEVLQKSLNEIREKSCLWSFNAEKQILSGGLFIQLTDSEIISTFCNKKLKKIKLKKIKLKKIKR